MAAALIQRQGRSPFSCTTTKADSTTINDMKGLLCASLGAKAAEELEEEEPEWTSRSEDLWEERQREREAQGLEREPHPLGEDYE